MTETAVENKGMAKYFPDDKINYYPETLKGIARMCDHLDAFEGAEADLSFGDRITVLFDGEPFGYLSDEVGGAYSWVPPNQGGAS